MANAEHHIMVLLFEMQLHQSTYVRMIITIIIVNIIIVIIIINITFPLFVSLSLIYEYGI